MSSSDVTSSSVQYQSVLVDKGQKIRIAFATATSKYMFIVHVANVEDLGWKEVRLICHCINCGSVGNQMSRRIFDELSKEFREEFSPQSTPALRHGAYVLQLYPKKGIHRVDRPISIIDTSFRFVPEKKCFLIMSFTKSLFVYAVMLYTASGDNRLNRSESQVLARLLSRLEPGCDVAVEAYQGCINEIKTKNYAIASKTNTINGHTCVSSSISTPDLRQSISNAFPTDIQAGLSQERQPPPPTPARSSSSDGTDECPYPGIHFRRKLKESGQAQVYEARTTEGKRVAVKIFKDEEGNGEEELETYKRELRMILPMSQHPNIVSVVDFFETPKPALVMDFIQGQDLSDYIQENGAFSESEGLEMCIKLADGLAHMHKSEIIHRDLKSANILRRNEDGAPIIIDLGLGSNVQKAESKKNTFEMTNKVMMTNNPKGTLLWMAPEMMTDNSWNDRTDVYAFGVIMWEIFSGQVPFLCGKTNVTDGSYQSTVIRGLKELELSPTVLMMRIVAGERPSLKELSGVEGWVKELINACWNAKISERPSMSMVLNTLRMHNSESVFKLASQNSDYVNFTKFVVFLEDFAPGAVDEKDMHSLFSSFDKDEDQKLSYDEFLPLLEHVMMQD